MRQKIAKKIKKAIEKTINQDVENRDLVVQKSYKRAKKAYVRMNKSQKKSFNESLNFKKQKYDKNL